MNSIYYNKPIQFGRFRGMTGRELARSGVGRSYIRWAHSQSSIFVSKFTARKANGFTGA